MSLQSILAASVLGVMGSGCTTIMKDLNGDFNKDFGPNSPGYNEMQKSSAGEKIIAGTILKGLGLTRGSPVAFVTGDGIQQYGIAEANRSETTVQNNIIVNNPEYTPYRRDLDPALIQDTPQEMIRKIKSDIREQIKKNTDELNNDKTSGNKYNKNIPGFVNLVDKEYGILVMTACNYSRDFNNDGTMSFDEFRGLKNQFSMKENIEMCFNSTIRFEPDKLLCELYGPNGDIIYKHSPDTKSPGICLAFKPEELREGNYSAVVYIKRDDIKDRALIGIDFTVTKD